MSADNGYILRKNSDGLFALQEYFASADSYPDVDGPAWLHSTLEDAVVHYEEIEATSMFPSEYGLRVQVSEVRK